jgi:hypothetical protein
VAIIGYAMLMSDSSAAVHYAGCFLVAMGLYVNVGLPLAWLPTNNPRYGKRTIATGLQLSIGNCAGIMSSFVSTEHLGKGNHEFSNVDQLYPAKEGPRFIRGHAVTLSMVAFASVVYALMWFYFSRVNARRARGDEDHKIQGMSEQEIKELGDDSPRFVYTI